jgi:hypothetical protein
LAEAAVVALHVKEGEVEGIANLGTVAVRAQLEEELVHVRSDLLEIWNEMEMEMVLLVTDCLLYLHAH